MPHALKIGEIKSWYHKKNLVSDDFCLKNLVSDDYCLKVRDELEKVTATEVTHLKNLQ